MMKLCLSLLHSLQVNVKIDIPFIARRPTASSPKMRTFSSIQART